MSVAISSAYQLNSQKPNLPEKRHLVQVSPTSANPSSATPLHGGATIEFLNLPTSASAVGSYISTKESYIKVSCRATVTTDTKTASLPKTGFMGCIEQVRVTSSGYVVEQSEHHNILSSFLRDMTEGDRNRTGVRNRLEGTLTKDTGFQFTAGTAKETAEATFCIPLVGQFWNSCEMLPCHAISDLAYRLTLASDANCLVNSNGDVPVTLDVTGFTLNLCYVEVSPESRQMLTGRTGMDWSAPAWEVIRDNLTGVAQETLKIPSAKSSMKTLAVTFQHADADNKTTAKTDPSARSDPGVDEYQWNVNGELYPRNPVEGKTQQLMELMRSFHEDRGYNTQIDNYGATSGTKNTDPSAEQYAIAVSLESHGKSQSSYSGVSTLTQNPMVTIKDKNGNFTPANVHYCCQFDQSYRIENGVIRVSY